MGYDHPHMKGSGIPRQPSNRARQASAFARTSGVEASSWLRDLAAEREGTGRSPRKIGGGMMA